MNYCDDFYYIKRGYNKKMIFFPGWAFDYRIFLNINIPFDYIFFKNSYLLPDFFLRLSNFLENYSGNIHLKSINILAWSMGCFFVVYNIKNLLNLIKIDKIYLLTPRDSFYFDEIDNKLNELKRDKTSTLKHFYKMVFLGHKEEYKWFKENLESDYITTFTYNELEMGLNYLRGKKMDLSLLKNIDIHLIFGTNDMLVTHDKHPIIPNELYIKRFLINSGHLPFFSKEFSKTL